MKAEGLTLVIATSATGGELEALLRQATVEDLIDQSATSSDAAQSKPDADIIEAALKRCGIAPGDAVMVGDTPYDISAANRADVDCIALRCGGTWDDRSLSGAVAIFDNPSHLLAHWAESPIVRRSPSR